MPVLTMLIGAPVCMTCIGTPVHMTYIDTPAYMMLKHMFPFMHTVTAAAQACQTYNTEPSQKC